MRSVNEHVQAALANVERLGAHRLTLLDARGCALAADVPAPLQLPGFDNSAADGYAVLAADVSEVPVSLPVAADIPAGGGMPHALTPRTVQRIMTGAPIPPGADAVVRVELTDGDAETVTITQSVDPGADIRWAASDVKIGDVILNAGDELNPARIGLLSAFGLVDVEVIRRPRVAIVSTGTELRAPGQALEPGMIYDSNSRLLAALVAAANAEVVAVEVISDEIAKAEPVIRNAIADADLLITSGGISAGAYEVIKDVMTNKGVEFFSVAMQPGKPQGLGRFAGVPVVALPGNPVSSAVSFEVFVRPMLRRLAGHTDISAAAYAGRLVGTVALQPGLTRFRRGHFDAATRNATLVGGPSSHYLGSMAQSNCLIVIPAGDGQLSDGDAVDIWLLP